MSPVLRPKGRDKRVLYVEGSDDQRVIEAAWTKAFSIDPPWECAPKGGVENLLGSLTSELKPSGAGDRVVGIVTDANGATTDRWRAIRDRLRRAGINAPDERNLDGTIIGAAKRKPRVGVWIMPDNSSSGEIEDFVARMVPLSDPIWSRSRDFIDEIPRNERLFAEQKTTRAVVHAWLATREDPRQMGTAIQAGDLLVGGELCQGFLSWLQRLFEPS